MSRISHGESRQRSHLLNQIVSADLSDVAAIAKANDALRQMAHAVIDDKALAKTWFNKLNALCAKPEQKKALRFGLALLEVAAHGADWQAQLAAGATTLKPPMTQQKNIEALNLWRKWGGNANSLFSMSLSSHELVFHSPMSKWNRVLAGELVRQHPEKRDDAQIKVEGRWLSLNQFVEKHSVSVRYNDRYAAEDPQIMMRVGHTGAGSARDIAVGFSSAEYGLVKGYDPHHYLSPTLNAADVITADEIKLTLVVPYKSKHKGIVQRFVNTAWMHQAGHPTLVLTYNGQSTSMDFLAMQKPDHTFESGTGRMRSPARCMTQKPMKNKDHLLVATRDITKEQLAELRQFHKQCIDMHDNDGGMYFHWLYANCSVFIRRQLDVMGFDVTDLEREPHRVLRDINPVGTSWFTSMIPNSVLDSASNWFFAAPPSELASGDWLGKRSSVVATSPMDLVDYCQSDSDWSCQTLKVSKAEKTLLADVLTSRVALFAHNPLVASRVDDVSAERDEFKHSAGGCHA